jgi:hypothetical protein
MNFKNAVWLFGFFMAAGLAQDSAPVVKEACIELEVGRKAPEFSLRDQFGHEQTYETLKGSKGAVSGVFSLR